MTLKKSNLPGWVNWLAQDADGQWWGYETEPNEKDNGWYENEVGRYVKLEQSGPPADWRKMLERVAIVNGKKRKL